MIANLAASLTALAFHGGGISDAAAVSHAMNQEGGLATIHAGRRAPIKATQSLPPPDQLIRPSYLEPLFPRWNPLQDTSFSGGPPPNELEPGGAPKLCSINVANYELSKILQELSTQTKTNLILLTNPETKLTLRLSKVKLTDMIRHLAAVTGLSYLKVGETYVIATDEQLKKGYTAEWNKANPASKGVTEAGKPDLVVETYMTRNVDSAQIAQALDKLYSTQITVIAGPAPTSPSVMQQNTNGSVGSAGAGVLQKETAGAQSGRMLIFKGPRDIVDAALALAKRMDYARMQWVVKVTVHDISNDALKELGLSWSFSNVTLTEGSTSGLGFGSFSRTPLSFLATLSALEKQEKAKLLSAPQISGMDGERAFILIGDKISFPNLVGYSNANTPIFEAKEIQVGIYLQVAGAVSDEKNVTLSIYPQVSAIKSFNNVNGALYPTIAAREAQTTLRARTGETIVLGGLLREEEIVQMSKVPLLGDIPFLGELFRHRRRSKVASQVVITLTPTIIPVISDESR